jgi:hypothetical protein
VDVTLSGEGFEKRFKLKLLNQIAQGLTLTSLDSKPAQQKATSPEQAAVRRETDQAVEPVPCAAASDARVPEKGARIIRLTPRVCRVYQGFDETGDTFFEGTEGLDAVVVPFRIDPRPSSPSTEATVTGRIAYFDSAKQFLHSVNYSCWVTEDFNFVSMGLRDTKELILAVKADPERLVVIQDNRHGVGRIFPSLLKELRGKTFYADVCLVEEDTGAMSSYSFRLDCDPLKAIPLISVPRTG